MTDFINFMPKLTFLVVMLTLLLTLVGFLIARKTAQNRLNAADPWKISRLEGNLWILTRNIPVIATIHGIKVEEPLKVDNIRLEAQGFSFLNSDPSKYFNNGTTILIKVDENMAGASFTIYYEEHKKESALPHAGYDHNLHFGDTDTLPSGVRTWTHTLY